MDKSDKYQLVKQDYGSIATWYDKTYDASKEMKRELDDFLSDFKPGQKILDAGCGPGKESIYLSQRCSVTALDLSPEMLAIVKKNDPSIETLLGDINQLKFENQSFDGIWSCRTIIHIPIEDLKHVFSEFHRVLKKNGVFGLISLNTTHGEDHEEQFLPEEDGADPAKKLTYYRNLYSEGFLTKVLEKASFKIIKSIVRSDTDNEPFIYIKAQNIIN